SATFSVSASGTSLGYQWYKGGSALASQTSSSLTLNGVTSADAGTYSVVVSGTCGSPLTNSASLTVNQNVAVSSGPASLTNCPGTSASFSVSASGTALGYQWYKGGSALAGQTGSSLTLSGVSSADAGTYSVAVSGACGSITNNALLMVNATTSASPMANLVRNPGQSAVLATVASGTGPFSYMWKK